jgi:hypothetical protein
VDGTLYGATISGGGGSCVVHRLSGNYDGCGIIYSLTMSGEENVLFDFKIQDGEPAASLLNVRGLLYGTTPRTSHYLTCDGHGKRCGTVFAFTL